MQAQTHTSSSFRVKQILMVALLFMMIGTALELYLLDHFEDVLQLIPLLCIGLAFLMMLLLLVRRRPWLVASFQMVLGITALSGLVGTCLHLRANFEFEQEMKPTATSWEVLTESVSGALPTLAPGSMIVLALLGYAYLILLKPQ